MTNRLARGKNWRVGKLYESKLESKWTHQAPGAGIGVWTEGL